MEQFSIPKYDRDLELRIEQAADCHIVIVTTLEKPWRGLAAGSSIYRVADGRLFDDLGKEMTGNAHARELFKPNAEITPGGLNVAIKKQISVEK